VLWVPEVLCQPSVMLSPKATIVADGDSDLETDGGASTSTPLMKSQTSVVAASFRVGAVTWSKLAM